MDRTFLSLAIIFFLAFTLFATFVFFNRPLTTLTRASEEGRPSAQQSLIFAWPLSVPANGTSQTTITVFARNTQGKSISGKSVTLTSSVGQLGQSNSITDQEGKALFTLSSSTKGIAEIEAVIDNIKVQRSISVKFE